MSRWARHAKGATGNGRAHHIDEIAHHFLGDGCGAPSAGPSPVIDVAVAAPGPGRAAACAAAGLAVAAGAAGWGSCLVEDEAIAWSATSFLGAATPGPLPPAVTADLPRGVRVQRVDRTGPGRGWLRWRLLGEVGPAELTNWEVRCGLPAAAQAAAPRWATLVWCAGAGEAALPAAAERLRRLVALLSPGRVEFLVLPEAWDARPGGWRLVGRRSDPGWRNVAHLQEVARAAAGTTPSCVRLFPDEPAAAGGEAQSLLAEVVGAVAGPAMARAAG